MRPFKRYAICVPQIDALSKYTNTRYSVVARALGLAAAMPLGRVCVRAKVCCIQPIPSVINRNQNAKPCVSNIT